MAYCNKCGKEVDGGDAFCHACGAAAVKPGEAAASEPPRGTDAPLLPPGSPPAAAFEPSRAVHAPLPPPGSPPATAGAAPVPPATSPSNAGQPETESPREIAERRVRQKLELWWHLGSYIIVNCFLVVIWAVTGAGYPWFVWVMTGWGIGAAFHVMHYLVTMHGESRRERMIQKELDKLQRGQGEAEEPPPEEG